MADMTFKDWLDFVSSTALALVAGLWAIYLIIVRREHKTNPYLHISMKDIPFGRERRLLLVYMIFENRGKIRLDLLKNDSFKLAVKRLHSDTDAKFVHWNDGELVTDWIDVLKDCNPHKVRGGTYYLEPGASYRRIAPIVVGADQVFMACVQVATEENGKPDGNTDTFFEVHRTGTDGDAGQQ